MVDELKSIFLQDIRSVFELFKRFLRPYIWFILALVFLNTCNGFLQALLPLSIAPAVNIILGDSIEAAGQLDQITLDNLGPSILHWLGVESSDFLSVIIVVVSIYLIFTVLMALLKTLAYTLSAFVAGNALNDLIIELHRHVLTLPLSFFNANSEGDLISRFTNDSTATVNLLDALIRGLLQSFIQALFLLLILFRTDSLLAFATLAIGGGHFLITRTLSGLVRRKTKKVYDFYGRMTAALQESLQNIRVTKCFAAEGFNQSRLETEASSVKTSLFQFRIARYIEEPFRLVADALSVCGMLFLAYYAMSTGELTKSGFGMFVFLVSRIVVPISDFSKHFLSIFSVAGSADRLLAIFSLRSPMQDGSIVASQFHDKIVFENVSFAHIADRDVVRNIDLEIAKGKMLAIVGPSGGGKSTLCDLLLRLHDPTTGRILFDGIDIRRYRKATYLAHFGVVPQENLLLNTSIRNNILFGRDWNEKNYHNSIKVANATAFINSLQEKDETQIGDRGVRLSGGQRQRLAIARALYGMPDILVLDEATSALDTESERAVQEAIDNAISTMTAIVVAHRLSTIMHADKIVVIENGRIEACGNHASLLQTSHVYKKLIEMQFRSEQF